VIPVEFYCLPVRYRYVRLIPRPEPVRAILYVPGTGTGASTGTVLRDKQLLVLISSYVTVTTGCLAVKSEITARVQLNAQFLSSEKPVSSKRSGYAKQ
jgi:hypothetical protein